MSSEDGDVFGRAPRPTTYRSTLNPKLLLSLKVVAFPSKYGKFERDYCLEMDSMRVSCCGQRKCYTLLHLKTSGPEAHKTTAEAGVTLSSKP